MHRTEDFEPGRVGTEMRSDMFGVRLSDTRPIRPADMCLYPAITFAGIGFYCIIKS